MKNVILDFESYYDKEVSVVTLGVPNYVAAADAYIVGVQIAGQDAQCGTLEEMEDFCCNLAEDPSVRPVAANSNFDQAWWEKYFPAFEQPWHCLLDHAAFHQYPRNLIGLSGVVLGNKVDKSTRDAMKGVFYEDLSDVATPGSPLPTKTQVQEYCANDCLVEAQCLEKLGPMSPFEEKLAAHTRMMNRRGVATNMELVEQDKTRLEAMRFEALKAIPWHADFKPLSYVALVTYCGSRGIPVPVSTAKTDEACSDLMTDNPELGAVIGTMRRFRRSNMMLKKIETLRARTTPEGILPLDFLYCGAPHTRRWSSKGFNVQNLDKEPLDVDNGQTVWTRNWIVPRAGYTFLILDYAQIEPRCLNWLAGNDEMMSALRHGFSYYEAYLAAAKQAQRVGWSGKPGTLKAEIGVAKYTKVKNESLGCGYGMGASKYTSYANVSSVEAKQVIAGFRAGNPKIVALWGKLDNLISQSSRDKSKHLGLVLPSGDLLQYFNIRGRSSSYEGFVTQGDFGHTSLQSRLWGGTLTENITQRMARDVLASAIIRLEEAGLRVAFHCHDEVILEVPLDSKTEARAEAEQIMTKPPEWAADLPLGVDGGFAESYTK